MKAYFSSLSIYFEDFSNIKTFKLNESIYFLTHILFLFPSIDSTTFALDYFIGFCNEPLCLSSDADDLLPF